VLPDEFSAMENCTRLVALFGEAAVRFIALFSSFDRIQGSGCGGKDGQHTLNITLIKRHGVLPGEIKAMKKRANYNRRLATMLGEIDVLFIARLNPFDRTQGSLCREKIGKVTLKMNPRSSGTVASGRDKRDKELRSLQHGT
jgi:hypothetical protein